MKKVMSILLTVCMLAMLLTGCGSKESTAGNDKTGDEGKNTEISGDESKNTANTQEGPDISEHVTIKWYLEGSDVTDDTAVLEKANEYLNEKLNMTLEPIWGTWDDFDQNVVLAINGGDDVDIYFTCSWTSDEYNIFSRKGAFLRLDDPENNLLEKYATDLWNILPDVLKQGATIDGSDGVGVYAIPGYKDIAGQYCWDINVPLLEKYGYTLDDIRNTDYYGFGDILKKVKEGEGPDFYPLLAEGAVLERMVTNGIIVAGDSGSTNVLSYYMNPEDPAKLGSAGNVILNKFATEEYKKYCEKTREYYLAGYIDPAMGNAAQANSVRDNIQMTGDYLIGTQCYALGYEVQASTERGFEVAMIPTTPAYVDTTSSQGAMMAISSASKNPERALMFLNLLNTDPYLFTLLDFGVEGIHYNMVNGEVEFTEKRADYNPWTNGMGNVTQLPPQKGQGLDFQDKFKEYYGNASEIPILGYTFNSDPVQTELGALANVAAEYSLQLSVGSIDPAEKLPEFLKKLEDNGINKVVDEANKQLTDYLAAQGK